MISTNEGLLITCNFDGKIIKVHFNSIIENLEDKFFIDIFEQDSIRKCLDFFIEIKKQSASFGWELNLKSKYSSEALSFGGALISEGIIIFASKSKVDFASFWTGMVQINNEQINKIRELEKEKYTRNINSPNYCFDELSRLNNDLVNMHRELFRKNQELKENKDILEKTLSAANMNWWKMDINTSNISFYPANPEILLHKTTILSHYKDFISPKESKDIDISNSQLISNKELYENEYCVKTMSGEIRWFRNTGYIIDRSEDLTPAQVSGLVMDITEHKHLEEIILENEKRKLEEAALRDSEEKFRKLVWDMQVGILIQNSQTEIILSNPKALELLGINSEQLLGKTSYDPNWKVIHEDGSPFPNKTHPVFQAIETKLPVRNVVMGVYRNSQDDFVWLLVDAEPQFNEDSTLKHVVVSFIDISKRKKAEKEVLQLSLAVEQSPDSILITDLNGKIEYVNPSLCEMTGYTHQELLGKNPKIFSSGETSSDVYQTLWETISSGNQWRGEFLNKKKNNELYWENVSISPIKNESGSFSNYLGIKVDVTKEKRYEEELKKSLRLAEEADKLKLSLLSNLNHEFRTPMNGILGMSSILLEEIQDLGQRDMLDQIKISSKRLMTTLNSVLALAQLEGKTNEYPVSDICINEVLKKWSIGFEYETKAKSLTYKLILPDKNIYINGSVKLLHQILSYLIDNAIKFTKDGIITLGLLIKLKNYNESVIVSVKDTGIGICEEDCDIIFKEFRQASEGYSRSYEGLGLGLSLVKKIAEVMKWKLTLESKINEGSTFSIEIPILKEKNDLLVIETSGSDLLIKAPRNIANATAIKKSVLYIEDNPINAFVVKKFLEPLYKYDGALNANLALAKIKETRYDLVLMDINLGIGMNGIELTKLIRKLDFYKDVPIIAITGYSMDKDENNFISIGGTDYLSKPFEKEEFMELIKKYL